jgi:hypothetical protein
MTQSSKKSVPKRQSKKKAASSRHSRSDPLDLSQRPIEDFHLQDLDPSMLVSPHFRLYELTRSETADRQGIDNGFASEQVLQAAIHLARQVLEPMRQAFGGFSPNSVFRSQALERVLKRRPAGWLSRSQHTLGQACDVEIVAMPTLELAQWAERHLPEFDQIIRECYDPAKGPNAGWVHISLRPPGAGENRKQTLSYVMDPASKRLVYVQGLRASVA